MAQVYTEIYRRYSRLAALLCVAIATLGLVGTAAALTRSELYQAAVPLADRSDGAHAAAFQVALGEVLVRVTGRRNAAEEAVFAPLLSNSRRYVQQYRGAPNNQVWVSFDGPAIERWLTQNGQPLWGHERPTTFIWVEVASGAAPSATASAGGAATSATGTAGMAGVLMADDTSELKSTLDAVASVRGIPLIWPTAADVQKLHAEASSASVMDMGRARGANAALLGRASNNSGSAALRWTLLYQDRNSEFAGTLEGINRAADTYAGLFAASGVLAPVDIEVSGVEDLRSYATIQGYLESLSFVSQVNVMGLTGDTVSYRLTTRGGIESLQHALALNGTLQSLPAGDSKVQRFQLRH